MKPLQRGGKYGPPTYDQAAKIAARFGGERKLAALLNIAAVTVYRWSYPRPIGTDGIIPTAPAHRIREMARLHGVLLTPEDWAPQRTDPQSKKPVKGRLKFQRPTPSSGGGPKISIPTPGANPAPTPTQTLDDLLS